jgi:hypothetical protein
LQAGRIAHDKSSILAIKDRGKCPEGPAQQQGFAKNGLARGHGLAMSAHGHKNPWPIQVFTHSAHNACRDASASMTESFIGGCASISNQYLYD